MKQYGHSQLHRLWLGDFRLQLVSSISLIMQFTCFTTLFLMYFISLDQFILSFPTNILIQEFYNCIAKPHFLNCSGRLLVYHTLESNIRLNFDKISFIPNIVYIFNIVQKRFSSSFRKEKLFSLHNREEKKYSLTPNLNSSLFELL